jgi:hypothetical protein
MRQRRTGHRFDFEARRNLQLQLEQARPGDRRREIDRQHHPVLAERQRLLRLRPDLRRHRRDLQGQRRLRATVAERAVQHRQRPPLAIRGEQLAAEIIEVHRAHPLRLDRFRLRLVAEAQA